MIIGLLREAAEHNPKLKDETLNFLLDLFAEVKPLSLWGTNKIDSVLDKSLHTVSDYLEELIQSDRTTPESKCKALKVLFSLGLLRGSLPNLLSVVDLLNKLKLDVDVVKIFLINKLLIFKIVTRTQTFTQRKSRFIFGLWSLQISNKSFL